MAGWIFIWVIFKIDFFNNTQQMNALLQQTQNDSFCQLPDYWN